MKHCIKPFCIFNWPTHYRNDVHLSGSARSRNFSWSHTLNPLPQNPWSSLLALLAPCSHRTFIERVPWEFEWTQAWQESRLFSVFSGPGCWCMLGRQTHRSTHPGLRICYLPFLRSTTVASQLLLSSISALLANPLTMFPAPFVLLSKHWCMHALYLGKHKQRESISACALLLLTPQHPLWDLSIWIQLVRLHAWTSQSACYSCLVI